MNRFAHEKPQVNVTAGCGPMGLLLILFVGLKLTGFIGWSWWLVTAPVWGIPALIAGVLVCTGVFFGAACLIKGGIEFLREIFWD